MGDYPVNVHKETDVMGLDNDPDADFPEDDTISGWDDDPKRINPMTNELRKGGDA